MKLSVIIPFVNEHPQIIFTVQTIFNELFGAPFKWEVIVIDNCCSEVLQQPTKKLTCPNCKHEYHLTRQPDKGGRKMESYSKTHSWLKYMKYDKKLSHWQAKNEGVRHSTGDILWFCDAHCVVYLGSLKRMFQYYTANLELINGSIHLPLLYILDRPGRRQIYKPVCKPEKGLYTYSFTKFRKERYPYTVAAMSTCGMMIEKNLLYSLGGWPEGLGIYGGGEQFMNYTLAILGKNKVIWPDLPLIHYADRRGYSFNASDNIRNRLIATYMFGGEKLLKLYSQHCKGRPQVKERMVTNILTNCRDQRNTIEKQQKIEISDWYYNFQSELIKTGSYPWME